jgi:hypothetical protein
MLTAVVLFCSVAIAREDCNEHTAKRWVEHPVTSQLMVECYTQAFISGAQIKVDDDTYMVVRCRRGVDL